MLGDKYAEPLLDFCADLVSIKSMTGDEGAVIRRIEKEMHSLGFDNVAIDRDGNIMGRIGNGGRTILFDSHTDTVPVVEGEWNSPPYCPTFRDGRLYGRGSCDMKSSLAASIYGAALAKEQGRTEGKTVLVSCSVMEEDFDGVALDRVLSRLEGNVDFAVICEPTNLRIGLGHKGRALYTITAKGVGVHASRHTLGKNALYEMLPIIDRVRNCGRDLALLGGEGGSIAVTGISSDGVSVNSIPHSCTVTVDRRICGGSSEADVLREAKGFVGGAAAEISVCDLHGKTWTGEEIVLHSFLPGWTTAPDAPLAAAARTAASAAGLVPETYIRGGCTNAVATAGKRGIPTILFGAGDEKMCHVPNEFCETSAVISACRFYSELIGNI